MDYKQYTIEDLELMNEEILDVLVQRLINEDIENTELKCPHCDCISIWKAGTVQGKQRYRCSRCRRRFIEATNTLIFSTKKMKSQWLQFIRSMLDGDSLMVSAEKADISTRTAFRWRHKILYLLSVSMNDETLSGVVHIDETLYPVIYKNPRVEKEDVPPKRGMSSQKINVTCAIDSTGRTILSVVDKGRVTSKSLISVYDEMIEKNSIVVSDSLRSYHQLMEHLNVDWKKIPSKKKSLGEYNLDPINRLHALLKDFTYKYKGISIKYLQGYLALFQFQRKHKHHHRIIVFKEIIQTLFHSCGHLKCSEIDSGNAIYLC